MTDIVERLRAKEYSGVERLMDEAADEIERLRAEMGDSVSRPYADELGRQIDELEAENARLRERVEILEGLDAEACRDRDTWKELCQAKVNENARLKDEIKGHLKAWDIEHDENARRRAALQDIADNAPESYGYYDARMVARRALEGKGE